MMKGTNMMIILSIMSALFVVHIFAEKGHNASIKKNTQKCNLCADKWLFVLSTGRSGSTSIMTMLNVVPGIFISGENGGAVNSLQALWEAQKWQERMGKGKEPGDAWSHPKIDTQETLCTMQLYVKQILGEYNSSSTQIIGFKEIRHVTEEQLNFFNVLFPCARFIINTREDVAAQAKSAFFKNKHNAIDSLKANTKSILQWASNMPEKEVFRVTSEQLTVSTFNRLLSWIGIQSCTYNDVHHSHNKNSYRADNRQNVLSKKNNCIMST